MAYTTPFKITSEMVQCNNLKPNGIPPVALDIGYSAVKEFAPFTHFSFPSFVKDYKKSFYGYKTAASACN